jgi:hypothetical protein
VDVLLRTIDQLSRRVDEIESARASDRQRIEQLEGRLEQQRTVLRTGARDGQGSLLNPAITGFVDAGGSLSSDSDDEARNRFNLRETELDLRAAVSPRADGVIVVAIEEEIEADGDGTDIGLEFGLEEAYIHFHTLTEDLSLKAGKFRSAFGRNNLLHTHDLPQVTRPLAVQAFLGPGGLTTLGASLGWIVPNPWDRFVELTTEVVNADGGDESPLLGGPDAVNPAVLAHLKLFDDVGETGTLELGTSFLHGRTSGDRDAAGYLLGFDATYQWLAPEQPDSESLLIQAELFWSNSDFDDETLGISRDSRFGAYVFGQYQFARSWYAGLRYDYTEFPDLTVRERNDEDWAISSYLSWYVNEVLRLRLEYQHLERDAVFGEDHEDSLLLGLTFTIGAHPPHPYWANR